MRLSTKQIKSILYILSGAAFYGFFVLLLMNPGWSLNQITYTGDWGLYTGYIMMGSMVILGLVTVYFKRHKEEEMFALSRMLGFWLVNIPLVSMITLGLTGLIWPQVMDALDSWTKITAPAALYSFLIILVYLQAYLRKDDKITRQATIRATGLQRQSNVWVWEAALLGIVTDSYKTKIMTSFERTSMC